MIGIASTNTVYQNRVRDVGLDVLLSGMKRWRIF